MSPLLQKKLLAWFDCHKRDLPWRDTRDPYRIWISEVMLQQTQVAAVIPFFNRFLIRFPDVNSLAEADEADVLRLWHGLGYYRRARDLHRSAQIIVARHGGEFPQTAASWAVLPGIGRYMQGAILSQAFEMRVPILEANTKRLLARLFAVRRRLDEKKTHDLLWQHAEEILPKKRIGDFNQALMELGSQVCTVKAPRCSQCPLAKECLAFQKGIQEKLPIRGAKKQFETVREVALIVRKKNRVLLCRRPSQGRWANMWEFPRLELVGSESDSQAATRLLLELGFAATIGNESATLQHTVTRFRITLACLLAKYASGKFKKERYAEAVWVHPDQLDEYPGSVPQRKLADALRGDSKRSTSK